MPAPSASRHRTHVCATPTHLLGLCMYVCECECECVCVRATGQPQIQSEKSASSALNGQLGSLNNSATSRRDLLGVTPGDYSSPTVHLMPAGTDGVATTSPPAAVRVDPPRSASYSLPQAERGFQGRLHQSGGSGYANMDDYGALQAASAREAHGDV